MVRSMKVRVPFHIMCKVGFDMQQLLPLRQGVGFQPRSRISTLRLVT